MVEYIFYSSDITGFAEYDIAGSEYAALITKCYSYCSSLSFYIRSSEVSVPAELESFRLPLTSSVKTVYQRYGDVGQIHLYRLSQHNRGSVHSISDSIFKWIDGWGYHNPEDPVFYRADGSVFLSSCIHEGRVSLFPRDDEDVSDLVRNPLWIKTESI